MIICASSFVFVFRSSLCAVSCNCLEIVRIVCKAAVSSECDYASLFVRFGFLFFFVFTVSVRENTEITNFGLTKLQETCSAGLGSDCTNGV